jgi:hypothetical protein
MAITSCEARVRQTTAHQTVLDGKIQMRKTTMVAAVAAALIATGFGVWATAPSTARVSPTIGQGIEPLQLMVNAKDMPRAEFVDYSFVFAH